MSTREIQILIAYHGHCLDGFTSAWICRRGLIDYSGYISEQIDTLEMTYGKLAHLEQIAPDYDYIYIVDFSVPVALLTQIAETSEVQIYDHHKTAMEMYHPAGDGNITKWRGKIGKANVYIDQTECGASLTYKQFYGHCSELLLPNLIRYVRDHDLWQHKFLETPYINKYLRVQEKDFECWDYIATMLDNPGDEERIITLGKGMQTYHDMIVEHLVAEATEVTIGGVKGLAVNCSPQFTNEVAHLLAVTTGTYGATWQQVGAEVKWSLRSERSCSAPTDVAALCQSFGGGGHKNAAGFTLSPPVQGKLFADEEDFQEVGVSIWNVE